MSDLRGHVLGREAERTAARRLATLGYRILATNVRLPGGEIDIVAEHGGVLVFVEVRARTRAEWGTPAETVDPRKRGRILAAARAYLARHDDDRPVRFDVVEVVPRRAGGAANADRDLAVRVIAGAFEADD